MEAMRLGHAHAQRYDALHEGLAMAGEGWALEMGVHRGTTLRYEGWEDHEARAWAEFVDRTDTAHRMITAPGVNQAIVVVE